MNLQTITREEIAEIYGVQPQTISDWASPETATGRKLSLVGESGRAFYGELLTSRRDGEESTNAGRVRGLRLLICPHHYLFLLKIVSKQFII